ncbi:MAG: BrnT family toxin [Thermomicrobiales bacterium]
MMDRPDIDRLEWDVWNLEHIGKHSVSPEEAEEVVFGDAIWHDSYKFRRVATGPTLGGRMLTVIIGETPGKSGSYHVFSARPSSRHERRDYREKQEGRRP